MSSLRKQLDELTNPAPDLGDLEDEDYDATSSKNVYDKNSEDEDEVEVGTKRIRPAVNLEEFGAKYEGTKTSRSQMFGDSTSFSLSSSKTMGGDEEMEQNGYGSDDSEELALKTGAYGFVDEDGLPEDDNDEDDEIEEFEDASGDEDLDDVEDEEDDGIQTMSKKSDDEKKAEAVRAQFQLWDHVMKLTIKTHAALRAYNQLPRGDLAEELMKTADSGTKKTLDQVRDNAFDIVETFANLEDSFAQNTVNLPIDDDDEEIESSEDEDDEKDGEEDVPDPQNGTVKEVKGHGHSIDRLHRLESSLSIKEKKFSKSISDVLTKWDERTRFVGATKNAKDMAALESSVMKQVDRVLSDKFRLLRKTQHRRTNNIRIGANAEAPTDAEIYDDDDFYQILLKDFIEQKNTETFDPIEMSRRFIELEKLKVNKVKKVVDPSGNYDKKVKFITIPKLVNFCPSRPDTVPWAHEKRNDLFRSLFK